jgi:tetratricopeptide (TPR) repeat protein
LYECIAYSFLRSSQYREAAGIYCVYLQNAQATAPILVNMAYAYSLGNRPELAETCLTKAIELDPSFQPAYHLRAALCFDQVQAAQKPSEEKLAELREQALADIQKAASLGKNATVEYKAAIIRATFGQPGPDLDTEVRRHLEKAAEYGFRSEALDREPVFSKFQQEPWFQRVLDKIASNDDSQKQSSPYVTPPPPAKIQACLSGERLLASRAR